MLGQRLRRGEARDHAVGDPDGYRLVGWTEPPVSRSPRVSPQATGRGSMVLQRAQPRFASRGKRLRAP